MGNPFVQEILTGKVKQLGNPNATNPMEKPWESGIFKNEIEGDKWLGKSSLEGDEVADKKNHGGPEKAVFAYPIIHYEYWKEDLQIESIGIGAFGENFAVLHMDESTVCIGDTYKIGEAIIQVSQPRRPCWKPARRFGVIDLSLRIQNSGKTGWYFRVLQEGYVRPNSELELLERPYPQWTISACNEVMYLKKHDLEQIKALASCEFLAINWKNTLNKRLKGIQSNDKKRVFGPNVEEK